MMKILHVSTFDHGGAGLAALRLHQGLVARGHDSRMLVLHKTSSDDRVYRFEQTRPRLPFPLSLFLSYWDLTLRKAGIPLSCAEYYRKKLERLRRGEGMFFTLPFSDCDLVAHPLVREAEVVHLHWVADFIDYSSFFSRIKKPVVWTIRDENLYLGGFHYSYDKSRCEVDEILRMEESLASHKRKNIGACRALTVVSLSRMMMEKSLAEPIVSNRKHFLIPSMVDSSKFLPFEKESCRHVLSLPRDKMVLLFVSHNVAEKRKGLRRLVMALNEMDASRIALCVVGDGAEESLNDLKIPLYNLGPIQDHRLLSIAYSAADVYVMPSLQEAFAKTPLEAMACGLPVVAFPCSGTEELINEKNGVRAADFTVESLRVSIRKALATSYDREWIRNDVIDRFGMEKIVSQYADLYREVLLERVGAK